MTAIYPGSFDPATLGHLDIIERASRLTGQLIVAVLNNPAKKPMFSSDERVAQLEQLTEHMPNVSVKAFSGLLVDFAETTGASLIIRGLRAVSDFEFEFQMALTNRSLKENIETLLIPTSTQYLYLSSSIVKEVAMYGGNIDDMVPPLVKQNLFNKFTK